MKQLLQQVSIFRNLEVEELSHVMELIQPKATQYQKGEYIFRIGDCVDSFGLLLSGKAIILQEEFWGNQNILRKINENEIFAESFACNEHTPMNVSVQAQEDCKVLFLSFKLLSLHAFQQDVACSKVVSVLLQDMARKNIYFAQKLSHVGQRNTKEKLLSYLSSVALQLNSNEFDIPFNRQELADYLYVDRSGLSQQLSQMQKEGYITYHKHHFILHKYKKI